MQIISKIILTNFRCHQKYQLKCEDGTTLILGENGYGKTSVLEAIHIALTGKSFRAADKDIVMRGNKWYKIELVFTNSERVDVVFNDKKTFFLKDKKYNRLPKDYKYPVVLFLPNDLNLIDSSPSRKRDYFDAITSQLNNGYSTILSRYNKALKQRNELLKQGCSREEVFSWDILMAKYGVEIREQRKKLIDQINQRVTKTYQSIAKNDDEISLAYKSFTSEVSESEYMKLLSLDFDRDRITGHTNFGVHKDDFEFSFNGLMANKSASRGETRSIVLALKFIESDLLYEQLHKKPLILLDDVFSELDKIRQNSLVDNFKNTQVILTSVDKID